ncbi:MAG: hypothetical protein AAFQ68_15630, partial [Bacteroidota bacterium]
SGFFFFKYTGKLWTGFAWIAGAFAAMGINYAAIANPDDPSRFSINFGYFLMAVTVLLPSILLLIKQRWQNVQWVLFALISFALALWFRIVDHEAWLPMGTHFLWHSFGALANFGMFMYAYLVVEAEEQAV